MSRLAKLRIRVAVGAVMLAVIVIGGTLANGGVALANNWTNRNSFEGYFNKNDTGDSVSAECTRGPVLYNDCYNATPAIGSSVNDADSVLSFLQGRYNNPQGNGGKWDKTGVSFIVNTMLGNDPDNAVRNLTSAMWTDLDQRLHQNGLTITRTANVDPSSYGHDTFYQHDDNDVAWYDGDGSDAGTALVFKKNGTTVYVLMVECGNPVGNFDGIPQPPHWTITASTTFSKTNTNVSPFPALGANEVIPGDTVNWNGTVKNTGPDATDTDLSARNNKTGGWTGNVNSQTIASGFANGATKPLNYSYSPSNTDLGKTLCLSTWADPHAWNDLTNPVESPVQCVSVVYRYELTPSATIDNGTSKAAEPGSGGITITPSVNNSGFTISKTSNWALTKCTYGPAVPSTTYGVMAAKSGSAVVCAGSQPVENGVESPGFPRNIITQLTIPPGQTVPDTTPAGTHICYILSVTPASWIDNSWIHSKPVCISVIKSPKVQAWGGDIRAGSVATGQAVTVGGKWYGSWAEYGIFGFGPVTGIGSNAVLAGGSASNPSSSYTASPTLNALTFANMPSVGNFGSLPAPDAYYNAYKALATAGSVPTGAVANGTHEIIHVAGSLTITSDITYTGSYANLGEIPRVIIVVDGDIKIDPSVQRIDAWLIAKGTLYTCSTYTGAVTQSLTLTDCANQLTFNGPVNVNSIVLGRTYGAGDAATRTQPAEIFNLSPDSLLSSYSASISQSNIQTVYEKELPPRW